LGATGALIGFGAVMTREQVDMIRAWQEGRIDEARALGRRVQRLADVVFARPVGDYRVRLKECLRILGVLEHAHVRKPLLPISPEERVFLAEVLAEVGLLAPSAPREPVATG
jgi:4-hydroxy-tetrahydrodipicolinate synthase